MNLRFEFKGMLAILCLIALCMGTAVAQDEGPNLKPRAKPKPAGATLLVLCDLACDWKLDGDAMGRIEAGASVKAKVELGQHLVVAVTADGADQVKKFPDVKQSGQTLVNIELQPVRDARLKVEQEAREKEAQEHAAREQQQARELPAQQYAQGQVLFTQNRYQEAMPLFQSTCDRGVADACNYVGWMYGNSFGVAQDFAQARAYYQRACEAGSATGCSNLGNLYYAGQGVAKNYPYALLMFQRSCDDGGPYGCNGLGLLYENGWGVARDAAQAISYYTKACNGGIQDSCTSLHNLQQVIQQELARQTQSQQAQQLKTVRQQADPSRDLRDHAIEQDMQGWLLWRQQRYAEAKPLFEQACDGGYPEGCSYLGVIYHGGQGVARDDAQARIFFEKACDSEYRVACSSLGSLYRDDQGVALHYARPVRLYQTACDNGEMQGCFNLSKYYEDGLGVSRNYSQANSLLQKACDGGVMASCTELGLHGFGVSHFRKACDGGDLDGCAFLGQLYRFGRSGVSQDFEQARTLFQRACDGGSLVGCEGLGFLFKNGQGVLQSDAQAQDLYKRACEGGTKSACLELSKTK